MKKITNALRKAIVNAINSADYDWNGTYVHDVRFKYRGTVYEVNENEDGTFRLSQLPYSGAYILETVNPSFELN